MKRRNLGFALLLAVSIPASFQAQAEPIKLYNTNSVTFNWTPASGPVVGYEALLTYIDGTESTPAFVGMPPLTLRPRQGTPFRLVVRACSEGPVCNGPLSEPAIETRLCILPSDIDCSGWVGGQDFILLSQDWGKVVEMEEEVPSAD